MRILALFFLLTFVLYAENLKNHQSIILSSLSTYVNAQNFIKKHLKNTKNPIFLIQSKRGFFIVTLGVYNTKKEVYSAINELDDNIKILQPFRGVFDYDLTKSNEAILYTTFKTEEPKQIITNISTIEKNEPIKETQKEKEIKEEEPLKSNNSYINSISLGLGKTNKQKDVQRVSIQKNFNKKISLGNVELNGYFDFAISRFDFNEKDIYNFSLTPVFKYNFNTINNFTPYIFAGIGASYLSNTYADGKNFSTNFQFEDRIGMGIKKDNIDFQLGYFHYSNASIKKPNDGIDMLLLNLIYSY